VRTVTEEQIAMIKAAAAGYAAKWKRFAAGLEEMPTT
jgi:hypothetical protein